MITSGIALRLAQINWFCSRPGDKGNNPLAAPTVAQRAFSPLAGRPPRRVRLRLVVSDGDWFAARCVEVEVACQGRSIEEALVYLREALELYFQDEPAPGALPEPIVAPIEVRLSA